MGLIERLLEWNFGVMLVIMAIPFFVETLIFSIPFTLAIILCALTYDILWVWWLLLWLVVAEVVGVVIGIFDAWAVGEEFNKEFDGKTIKTSHGDVTFTTTFRRLK